MTKHVHRQAGNSGVNAIVEGCLDCADFKGAKVATILATDLPAVSGDTSEIKNALRACISCASEALTPSDSIMVRTLRREENAVVMIATSAPLAEEKLAESKQLI
ncbi:MAG: hypothetical protein ABH834_02680 [Candidatus Altiarchaeota archaeon]